MAEAVDTEDRFGDLSALLWLVTAGDQTAFRRLYEREATRLYTVALRLTGSAQLAAEAVHATLTAIWRNTVRFDPQGNSPEGWLLGLLRGRAIDIMRRRQRDGLGLEVSARQIDPEADLARLAQSPYAAPFAAAMTGLERDGRHLLVMAYLDGLSHAEIAQRMRLPIGTVKAWIRRSLELLRQGLEAQA